MLKINFEVNKEFLARVMISKNCMPTDFANYLWDEYRDSYRNLKRSVSSADIDVCIIEEIQVQDFFVKNIVDSQNNLARVKSNWDKNKEKIYKFLKGIFKIDFDLEVTVYVVPTNFNTGRSVGCNRFIWGHSKGVNDINYDLVYLVHESLHSYFEKGNLTHAIIENIADVELAKFLNNTNVGYKHHDHTQEEHIKIYPYWNLYLNKSKENIEKEQKNINIYYNVEDYESERKTISKFNINEFILYLKKKLGE